MCSDEFSVWFLVLKLFLAILALSCVYLFCKKKMKEGYSKQSLVTSVKVLFLTLGIYYIVKLIGERMGCAVFIETIKPFKDTFVVLILAWTANRWKEGFFSHTACKEKGVLLAVSKICTIVIALLTSLFIFRIFSLDIVPLLAFGGIGAAVLGFAAKDVMSSFFGGLLLSLTRPFSLGDLILIPEKNLEGYVEDIGWCITLIRDKDKRAVHVSNSLFSHMLIVNASTRNGRRILEDFRIGYGDFSKISVITERVKESLKKAAFVDLSCPILVFISEIGPYSFHLTIDLYTTQVAWKDYVFAKEEALRIVFSVIDDLGAKLVYPISLTQEPD
jgi:MscS family membrane protein